MGGEQVAISVEGSSFKWLYTDYAIIQLHVMSVDTRIDGINMQHVTAIHKIVTLNKITQILLISG